MKKKLKKALKELQKYFDDAKYSEVFQELQKEIDAIEEKVVLDDASLSIPADLDLREDVLYVFSDGACRGNPGPGAYGSIVQSASSKIIFEDSEVFELTTNNKMELLGAIKGLEFVKAQSFSNAYLVTDSKYLVDGITKWVPGWKSRGWKKADKKAPENLELWQRLDDLNNNLRIRFQWVRGHNGHPQNEYCDKIANIALDQSGY